MQLTYPGQRACRICWGLLLAGACIFSDRQGSADAVKHLELWILAIGVIGIFAIELSRYVISKGFGWALATVVMLHICSFFAWPEVIPFNNSFSLAIVCYLQSLLLGIIYVLLVSNSGSPRVPPLMR
jgi:hypothetical protein